MEVLIIVLGLLTTGIIALVSLIVWRDRRELKLKQIAIEINRVEEILNNFYQNKQEFDKMLDSAKRYTDNAISQVEGQIKQIKNTLTHIEQRLPLVSLSGDKKETGRERERNHKTQGKGKSRGSRDPKHQSQKTGEIIKINDGEKYARIYEMAEKGLNTQEIAQKLNLGHDEVELVLELKGKKLS
ncbi:MAG TPA: hypothetical protein GXX19_04325 [Syntrophomonadaceae bacterium]|nr:hypothetical protein [Syntrophomonadaceae bacterium]